MQITPELLEKYANGFCSKEERKLIEQWLHSGLDHISKKNVQLFAPHHKKVWKRIKKDAQEHQTKVISLRRDVLRYSAAACIVIALYYLGNFLPNPSEKEALVQVVETEISDHESTLYVSMVNGKAKKISAKNYNIEFEGIIRLYSLSKSEQVVVCNGKKMILNPNRPYFIQNSSTKGFVEFDRQFIVECFDRESSMDKYYEVCIKS